VIDSIRAKKTGPVFQNEMVLALFQTSCANCFLCEVLKVRFVRPSKLSKGASR
jgi:hypothetical protein